MRPCPAVLALQGLVLLHPSWPGSAELPAIPTRMWLFFYCEAEQAAAATNDFF